MRLHSTVDAVQLVLDCSGDSVSKMLHETSDAPVLRRDWQITDANAAFHISHSFDACIMLHSLLLHLGTHSAVAHQQQNKPDQSTQPKMSEQQ